ncbi:helix-turn-helix domain-containing protein [Caballeronia catudaia]|uniref:helix-turn-helix domain-containing protein n=1 Tax=Caballeronia catudaia TaxID=1777136 RepID=UPI0007727277|nr:helix-turn-helix domain-containing protein [Caballeronia catudaia]
MRDHILIRTLELAAALDHELRRARTKEAAIVSINAGQSVGRPCSLSGAARAEALKALSSGSTVTQVARALNTSTQTIMRIRNAENAPAMTALKNRFLRICLEIVAPHQSTAWRDDRSA